MPDFATLADERFISLTTFRKSGEGVSTPVWVARDGDALVVTTPAGSGKVKRLRRDPRVEIRPSTRRGEVSDDAPVATGTAQILTDDDRVTRFMQVFRGKYGLEYRVFMLVERVLKAGNRDRVILRVTAGAEAGS